MLMVSEYNSPPETTAGTNSGEFTSDPDGEQSSSDENVYKELVLLLSIRDGSGSSVQPAKESQVVIVRNLVLERFSHLSNAVVGSIISIFTDSDIVKTSLLDLHPA